MSELHCLYCERPLALLHRLTGDKEFCSKEHRRLHMKEHGDLALSVLMQAQTAEKARPQKADKTESRRTGSILGLNFGAVPPAPKMDVPPARIAPTAAPAPAPAPVPPPAAAASPAPRVTSKVRVLTTPPPAPKQDPSSAGFRQAPPVPVDGLVTDALRRDVGARAEPRWRVEPPARPQAATNLPLFVTSGAFLRKKLVAAQPPSYWTKSLDSGPGLPLEREAPILSLVEDRLRRTERIGFCPP